MQASDICVLKAINSPNKIKKLPLSDHIQCEREYPLTIP